MEDGVIVIKGEFDTAKEALDLANKLNREYPHNLKPKNRYQWQFVGSRFFFRNCYDYDIIDTLLGEVVESYNSIFTVKRRIKQLNSKKC